MVRLAVRRAFCLACDLCSATFMPVVLVLVRRDIVELCCISACMSSKCCLADGSVCGMQKA